MRRLILALVLACVACKPKPPTSPHCVSNAEIQFKRIDDLHAKYKAGEHTPTAVYYARYYLEVARFVLTGKGIDGSAAACAAGDHDTADYDRLIAGLEARGHDVEWMEVQRGVKFTGVVDGGVHWTWQNTGKPVDNNDANVL